MKKSASISMCGKYRWQLSRIWDDSLPKVLFLMHNPSTADADQDDPTIRRCIGFAKSWGYGGIYVGNLSPYRATNPNDMISISMNDLVPNINEHAVREMAKECTIHILAFGNPIKPNLKLFIPDIGKQWHCLKKTKSGNPYHPLYLKSDLTPIPC